ncbi:hypothetical protein CKO31_07815 [Thiohalocapsa halophila]|uniref:DUF3150 domain-containing protein n=1 Tax=Thiohalocapsa halophila TaxID=69359 RepID=A0ABS1CFG6_9GAMM|nr:DUF3150 domain-containing protein [Thiohalocapsa halophila]MBK1630651.1 hypothetical protein [Thiohalocapsa halophila]
MTMHHTIETITDRIVLVMLGISIWSGRKKLKPEDLNLVGGEIPPEELVSLGSKRVCDPEPLKPFHRIKQSAERACLRVGTRFLGGYAVPQDYAEELATKLDALRAEFTAERTTFIDGYDRALEDWIAKLPEFEAPIRRAVEPANVVGGRLRFGYQLVEIKPTEQPGTLMEEVQELGNGIFAEVEQMARDLEGSFEGKDKLHRRALGTFHRIREKLACLSFIDPRIQPVVDSIDDWFGRLPATAPIEGALFNEGMGLALLLSDAERMARHGAGQIARAEQPDDTDEAQHDELDSEAVQMPMVDFDSLFEGEDDEVVAPSATESEATEKQAESFFF